MLSHNLATVWQWMFTRERSVSRSGLDSRAAIHNYDPIENVRSWTACRDRAQFHLGRARRAKDRGDYRTAAREIERALDYDDTNEAYFLVLGQCHLRGNPVDPDAARRAFERALTINPQNAYTMKLLSNVRHGDGNDQATGATLERAKAAGVTRSDWRRDPGRRGARRALTA
jgi:tetratricopeptide (TPR) repeat protein